MIYECMHPCLYGKNKLGARSPTSLFVKYDGANVDGDDDGMMTIMMVVVLTSLIQGLNPQPKLAKTPLPKAHQLIRAVKDHLDSNVQPT